VSHTDNPDMDFLEPTSEVRRPTRSKVITRELAPPTDTVQLVILAGNNRGRRFQIVGQALIGRHPAAQVWLQDDGVSGRHAAISSSQGKYVLRDLGSRNGTRVNGASIQEQELAFGDKISLGARTVLVFTYADPLEEQLLQLQKMEAIGRLAAGMAHEFNNLLAVVLTNLGLMQQRRDLNEMELVACMEEARQAATRGAELTRRMLDYARLSESTRQPLDLSRLLDEIVALTRRIFDPGIHVQSQIADDLHIEGDRLQVYQAVMNLMINARDAMPGGGQLIVGGSLIDLDGEALESLPNLAPGPHVRIHVADTGRGMDAETLQKACDLFFTTKQMGEGTGLGLSMSRSIIHRHGGEIAISSQSGQGTQVEVYLPAIPRVATDGAESLAPQTNDNFSGLVLVVDDDVLVCRSLSRTLRIIGFEVIVAESGEAGVEAYRQRMDEIRLVLLDVVMPGIDGEETLARLLALDPKVNVVVSSGYTEEDVIRRMLQNGALGFLKKPYELEDLKGAIRSALKHRTDDVHSQIS